MPRPHRKREFSARAVQAFSASGYSPGLHILAAADGATEIQIYDAIGDDGWGGGVSASAVTAALAGANGGPVNIRINSPGGDVFAGMAIYNALLAHPGTVTCFVDGVAASAASFIACAGSQTIMGDTSMMMIHNSSTLEWGDRNAMFAVGAVLAKIDNQLASIYANKSGGDAATFAAMMDAETWMTAQEAKDSGLADAVAEAPKPKTKAEAPIPIIAEPPVPIVAESPDFDIEIRRRRLRVAEA